MASTNTAHPPNTNPHNPSARTSPQSTRDNRGESRGVQQQPSFRGRGRGRGRRARDGRPAPPRPPPDDLGGGGFSGHRTQAREAIVDRVEELKKEEGDVETLQEQIQGSGKGKEIEEEMEAEICFICASSVLHNSVAPCNHRTCHICALRLRALYKTRACAHCRTEAKYLIFTDDANKRYEDFAEQDVKHTDETLGVKYTDNDIHADTVLLLRYNCPNDSCDVACLGWPHLHHHVKNAHHKIMCDLCTRNKKVFTHEHELFTPQELRKHERVGDDHPGAVDQSGFKGHPECGFCQRRFYGDDELYIHCREQHERCHICDKRREGGKTQYFLNYDSLEQHFRKDHFLCLDKECLDKKFIVFESEMDLKAHQLEVHPNGLTKDARRDARRVDISTFDYRTPHQEPRRGRGDREARDRTRGRDPNSEPIPQSTAQQLRRDEIAYQRQLAILNSQAPAARSSGGQLFSDSRSRPTFPANMQTPSNAFEALDLTSQEHSTDLTPQQQARQIAHAALLSRASALLSNNATKLTSFRSAVSSYQHSRMSAGDLITTFFSLFDVSATDLGKLVHELAELYEDEKKREGLLKAWADWRAINEDYPSLPASAPNSLGGASGHRVLKLKSSTANSARGAQVSKTARGWGAAAATTGTNSSATPSYLSNPSTSTAGPAPRGPAISSTGSIAKVGTTTPWASSSSSAPAPASRPNSAKPAVDAFPALPAAKKPNTLIAGLSRGKVRPAWEGDGVVGSAWGSVDGRGAGSGEMDGRGLGMPEADGEVGSGSGKGGKKKGKQGKQVLYKFG